MDNFKGREKDTGERPIILNIEELATVWHFPTIGVMAPGVVQAEAKKAAAPTGLPLELPRRDEVEEVVLAPQAQMKKASPPPAVPRPSSPIAEAGRRAAREPEAVIYPQGVAPIPAQPSAPEPIEEDSEGAPPPNLPIG